MGALVQILKNPGGLRIERIMHSRFSEKLIDAEPNCAKECREFYMAIDFRACLWPTPSWVWTNNDGKGYNTHVFQTIHVRNWMAEKGITEHHVTCRDGLWHLK